MGGDLPPGGGKLDFGRAPAYSHFASASSVREMVSLAAVFPCSGGLFLGISEPESQLTEWL